MSHFDDDPDERRFDDDEPHEIRGALLNDTIATLQPAEPICLLETATVDDAIARMLERRHAGVLVVDDDGRLSGIFTERDVLTRVAGAGLDARRTLLHDVMTPNPEALAPGTRIAYAVQTMSVAGFRTIPLIDAERRPVGVVTVSDIIRWLAHLFPEAVLNLPPGDVLKNPHAIDAG
jgi:CBS domain-containing protein